MSTWSRGTPARIALFNYGAVLLLSVFLGIMLTLGDNAANLVGLKLLVVPMWFLALGGLNAIYRRPIVESRLTVRSLEHALLHALLFCAFLAVMWWTPERAVAELLRYLAIVALFVVPWRLYELRRQIHEERRRDP